MDRKLSHIAVFGLKGFPALGGTSAVGENIIKQLNGRYKFTVYATSSHAGNKSPYPSVSLFIFRKFLPHKLNVFYYNLMAALHALLFVKYDIVHTHQIDTGFIVPLLRLKYKVVSTHHGKTYEMSKWGKLMKVFFRITERLMINNANEVSFVAESERQDAQKKYGGNYSTILNGIDPEQAIHNRVTKADYIMFAAGRIIPHKGCHVFLDALRLLKFKGEVLIAGDHKQMASYQNKIEAYQDDLNIRFLGMIADKAELLDYVSKARFFVFPSFYEAMSMMLLEVALVKTPLICSDIIENKAVFSENEVEFFKAGDSVDLADRISYYLHDDSLSSLKAEKAYQKVMRCYQWKDIAQEYSELYETLIIDND